MKTRILIKEGEYRLAKAGCMDAKIDSEELYCFLTGIDRLQVFMKAEEEADEDVERKYLALIARRAERIPLQYITGVQEFMGHRFKVDQSVLIPRQDTETLVVEAARTIQSTSREKVSFFERLRGGKEWEVLDLCCGSGAIGISLAKICDNIHVTGADISGAALAVAQTNARSLHVKAEYVEGDLFAPLESKKFDMIVSNPPYIRTNMIAVLQEEIKNYEPRQALDGGRDGLDYYRRIIEEAPNYLKSKGYLMFEIGSDQGEDLRKMLKDDGRYTPAEVIRDLPGRDRVVKTQLK
ncbi:MAG: peptide chain release factor N(5)-glutamine methyltransferase [Firmicutes bacterium]|nr:peptide chain release factor N(5)-glutamine methyltransferase [Bacillota bacterium]